MSTIATTDGKPPLSDRGVRKSPQLSINSRCDWVTATTDDHDIGVNWLQMYLRYSKSGKFWESDLSFHGFQGRGVDGFKWLYNPKSEFYMVILSGSTSGMFWPDIVGQSKNVTRLDLAATALLVESDPTIIPNYYNALSNTDKAKREYALTENTGGGMTLYVGKRASSNFGRVYDKGVESGEFKPGVMIRYEVELKKPLSYGVAMEIAKQAIDTYPMEWRIASYVWSWFNERAITPIFEAEPVSIKPDVSIAISTSERKLNWLRTQVRPTVKQLCLMGMHRDVFNALGINAYIQPNLFEEG